MKCECSYKIPVLYYLCNNCHPFGTLCYACLSVCPHGSAWFLLDGFSLHFKLGTKIIIIMFVKC
jgi:hypothetical protein